MKKSFRIALVVLGAIILAGLIGLVIYHWVTGVPWPAWTGFSDYTGTIKKDDRGKTLWDWMGLLIIPLVLGGGVYWLNRSSEKANRLRAEKQHQNDQEIATDLQREQALQSYIDRMTELLLSKSIRESKPEDETRIVARTRTLTTLGFLDGKRKGILVRFLFEAGLINADKSIVILAGADLVGANLNRADLVGANLSSADIKDATLHDADLSSANLVDADLQRAELSLASLVKADLQHADMRHATLWGADLSSANLVGANMYEAEPSGANLSSANLMGADLHGAHLRGANLRGANLSRAFLTRADLSEAILEDANLRSAILIGANLEAVGLETTHMEHAEYSQDTKWPDGFDPKAAGAELVDANKYW